MSSHKLKFTIFAAVSFFVSSASSSALAADLIVPEASFTADGVVSQEPSGYSSNMNTIERGSVNGVNYRIYYSDGSAAFVGSPGNTLQPFEPLDSNWSVGCRKDKITDQKSCHVYRGGLWVWIHGDGAVSVSLGLNIHPGTSPVIRIDSHAPFYSKSTNEGFLSSTEAKRLMAQLETGQGAVVRYTEWPSEYQEREFDLYGFNEAFAYAQWALDNMR